MSSTSTPLAFLENVKNGYAVHTRFEQPMVSRYRDLITLSLAPLCKYPRPLALRLDPVALTFERDKM